MFVTQAAILITILSNFVFVSSLRDYADTNNPTQLIVIIVDGFGFEYLSHLSKTEYLSAFFKSGVHAKLLPAFPAEPLPNMYSIVTGLSPSEHGIIANEMIDSRSKKLFNGTISENWWFANSNARTIWSLREKINETVCGCVGLPMCCITPKDYPKVQGCRQIKQDADSEELMKNVFQLATEEKKLIVFHWKQLAATVLKHGTRSREAFADIEKLNNEINMLIVGTSGMVDYKLTNEAIILTDYVSLEGFRTLGGGSSIQIVKNSKTPNYELLEGLITIPNVHLYRRKDLRKMFPSPVSKFRSPEVWIVAEPGWRIYATDRASKNDLKVADYGYRPEANGMYGLLMAFGQNIKPNNISGGTFKTEDVFHLMKRLIDIDTDPTQRNIYKMINKDIKS